MKSLAPALVSLLALAGCDGSDAPETRYAAPASSRVALVLEPPVVPVGDVAQLELAVVTTPGHTVKPFELPARADGFWLVERQPLEIVKEPARWVHRARLRLRAIEVGRFEFPGGSVEVAAPDGGAQTLHYDALPLEIVSTLSDPPARPSPWGVRTLPLEQPGTRGALGAFAAGAVLAFASVGVLLLARRRLAERDAPATAMASRSVPAWELARVEIEGARGEIGTDPRRALDLAAAALRGYAVRRFGGDATVRTTPELRTSQPPFTMTTRWSGFVALLDALDATRFPAAPVPEARAHELADAVAAFVEESVPPEARA